MKIDNWQYINCINLWVRFICVNYKDCNNVHSLFSSVVQIIRGVAHLLPGMRYLPLRLKLAQMLNELSNCNQMFFPVPSLIFGCLEFLARSYLVSKFSECVLHLDKFEQAAMDAREIPKPAYRAVRLVRCLFTFWVGGMGYLIFL